MSENDKVKNEVKRVYGGIAQSKKAGCSCNPIYPNAVETPEYYKDIGYAENDLDSVPDTSYLGLGCGNPTAIAGLRENDTVIDLGSGGGFDCFLAAKKVGKNGRVIGIDMTEDMIKLAKENAAKKNYSNVEFYLGEIEAMPASDAIADVVISNCVVNLSTDKFKVFKEIARVLKPNGRVVISDIVEINEIPEDLRKDILCYAGCISGAIHVKKLETILQNCGFKEIAIKIKEESSEYIKGWAPGTNAEKYVAAADISAVKI